MQCLPKQWKTFKLNMAYPRKPKWYIKLQVWKPKDKKSDTNIVSIVM
jgi:hypothetical protein